MLKLFEVQREVSWKALYSDWSFERNRYPELREVGRFESARWPTPYYCGLDQPARLIAGPEHSDVVHLDWWPLRELEQRRQVLLTGGHDWGSPLASPAQASRYTLLHLWEAKQHANSEEALAAVWTAACLGMWKANLPDAWRGPFVDYLEELNHAVLSRIDELGIQSWSRSCRHLLPESLAPLFRRPEHEFELRDMISANVAYVVNRWVPVRLMPEFVPRR